MNEIVMKACESSQIAAYGYDRETQTLAVAFKKKNGPDSLYHYADVPDDVFEAFDRAASKGAFFGSEIRHGGYGFQKIEPPPEPDSLGG
jgi:hypothetical protein